MQETETGVLFSNDYVSDDNTKKLYCRIRTLSINPSNIKDDIKVLINNTKDPVLEYINNNKSNNKLKEISNFKISIKILTYINNDFKQYNGFIEKDNIEKLQNDEGLVKGIEISSLYIWIYGLLINGIYNDGENYQFDLLIIDKEIYWVIKILHYGLFKIFLRIKVKILEEVDIDEYFIDDLENYYYKKIEYNKNIKNWKLKEVNYLKEIEMLKNKNEMTKLRNSVRLMKNRINDYFLPLVNSLFKDKKDLIDRLNNENGEIFFSSKRKRDDSNIDIIEEISKQVKKDGENDEKELDWMQNERNKRLKLKEIRENGQKNENENKIGNENENENEIGKTEKFIKEEINFSEFSESDNESILFNKRNNEEIIETQPDNDKLENIEEVELQFKDDNSKIKEVVLDEDTQLDESDQSTEISSGSDTELSQ